MVFDLFKGKGESQIELIEGQLQDMLTATGETMDMAMDALFGRVEPAEIEKALKKRDRSVNRNERAIRRELIVHAGVRGAAADVPLLLVYMSIIKDIERIGDYTKNIWDVAATGVAVATLPEAAVLEAQLIRARQLIDSTAEIFKERDVDAASEILPQADAWTDELDAAIDALATSERPSREGVPLALIYRYQKRIVSHLMNVLSSLVMPVDRLDYWDESKADRA